MKKIVVIEDQQLIGSIYRTKFAAEGFSVEVAVDGESGLELIKQTKPDIVLLDWMLPKLNGIEVLKRLRANTETSSLPVILFSSSLLQSMTEEAWKAGATAVLSKATHSPKLVVEAVRQALASVIKPQSAEVVTTPAPTVNVEVTQSPMVRVLVVEDHEDTRALVTYLLNQAGHQVALADSEESVLRRASEGNVDVFLLNRRSANGTALQLCQVLSQTYPAQPVLIYSASSSWKEQQEGLKAGAVQYLSKPEDVLNVGAIVSKLTEHMTTSSTSKAA